MRLATRKALSAAAPSRRSARASELLAELQVDSRLRRTAACGFVGQSLRHNDVVLNRGGGVFRWGGCAIGW